jgi:hypothetical protein
MAKSKKSFNKKNKNKSIKLGGSFIFGTSFETKKKIFNEKLLELKDECMKPDQQISSKFENIHNICLSKRIAKVIRDTFKNSYTFVTIEKDDDNTPFRKYKDIRKYINSNKCWIIFYDDLFDIYYIYYPGNYKIEKNNSENPDIYVKQTIYENPNIREIAKATSPVFTSPQTGKHAEGLDFNYINSNKYDNNSNMHIIRERSKSKTKIRRSNVFPKRVPQLVDPSTIQHAQPVGTINVQPVDEKIKIFKYSHRRIQYTSDYNMIIVYPKRKGFFY